MIGQPSFWKKPLWDGGKLSVRIMKTNRKGVLSG